MSVRSIILILIWLAILAGCVAFVDQPVKQWLYSHHFHDPDSGRAKDTVLSHFAQAMGYYPTVVALVLALVVWAKLSWRHATVILTCGALTITNEALKFVVGRARPIARDGSMVALWDFVPLSLRAGGNGFPSGHTFLAFATAACLARYYPRWAWASYLLAAIVAVTRVLEVAHHVSDVVGAAGIGILMSMALAPWLERKFESLPFHETKLMANADTGAETK